MPHPTHATIEKSSRKHKKFVATVYNAKGNILAKVHFGDVRYEDYTMHHDTQRRNSYLSRATAITDAKGAPTANNPLKPNFWAVNLLWQEKTLKEAATFIDGMFGIKVTLKIK